MHRFCGHDVPEWVIVVSGGGRGDLQVRTKPTMYKRMLRSVLVVAFSAVAAFGVLEGLSDAKSDVRADSHWPAAVVNVGIADDGSGS